MAHGIKTAKLKASYITAKKKTISTMVNGKTVPWKVKGNFHTRPEVSTKEKLKTVSVMVKVPTNTKTATNMKATGKTTTKTVKENSFTPS